MLSIAETVLFCGRQGLALHGHDESNSILTQTDNNDGNFRALLRFRIDAVDNVSDRHLNTCGKNARYTSPSVQNELIVIGGKLITDEIAVGINAARSFTVLADVITDCSWKEQLSVCVRYVH